MKKYQSKKDPSVIVEVQKIEDLPYYAVLEPTYIEPYILEEEIFNKYFTPYNLNNNGSNNSSIA